MLRLAVESLPRVTLTPYAAGTEPPRKGEWEPTSIKHPTETLAWLCWDAVQRSAVAVVACAVTATASTEASKQTRGGQSSEERGWRGRQQAEKPSAASRTTLRAWRPAARAGPL